MASLRERQSSLRTYYMIKKTGNYRKKKDRLSVCMSIFVLNLPCKYAAVIVGKDSNTALLYKCVYPERRAQARTSLLIV